MTPPRAPRHGDGGGRVLSTQALNRALLARQGLLAPFGLGPAAIAARAGAIQAQHWPAVAVALWTRAASLDLADVIAAFASRELVVGTLLRITLHAVPAAEHPAYAAVSEAAADGDTWRRASSRGDDDAELLRRDVLAYAAEPRSQADLASFIEAWIAAHPGALDEREIEAQRQHGWRAFRRWPALLRVPVGGRWGGKSPEGFLAAPGEPASRPRAAEALHEVALRHLRAFGPAAAEDVAHWIGWRTPPVRDALEAMGDGLVRFADEHGRVLHDVPDAALPDPDEPAPPRFLPAFDGTLLAFARRGQSRIIAPEHRGRAYVRANLRWLPTFLAGGFVAGTWTSEARASSATLVVRPFAPLAAPDRDLLAAEGERLLSFVASGAARRELRFEPS